MVIHPAVYAGLRVRVSHVGEGPIQVKELPLGWRKRRHFSGCKFESSGMEILRRTSGLRIPVALSRM